MSGAAAAEPEGGTLLLNQPVVIDNGTASIKAGFAGSSKPKVNEGIRLESARHPETGRWPCST